MPVTLKHLYNSSLCNHRYTGNSAIKLHAGDFSAMNLGLGWRLNIMQSMVAASFQHEGEICNGYVYVGENGEETYFKQSTETKSLDDGTAYNLYETIDDSELFYDPIERTMDLGGHSHLFDASGRLVKITDQHNNSMDIIYADGKITYVRDGAEHDGKGREFAFVYTDDLLTSITAPDNSVVQYSYTSGKLTGISYPGNMNAEISYKANNLPSDVTVTDADNIPIYRVRYQYVNSQIAVVDEFGAEYYTEQDGNTQSTPVAGKCTCYEYSAARRRTLVRSGLLADSVLVDATAITDPTTSTDLDAGYITVYTYDDDGDVLSEYAYATPSNAAGVVGSGHGVGPYFESGVNTIAVSNNLLANHTFNGFASWTKDDVMAWGIVNDEAQAKYGQRAILMTYTPADGAETVVSKGISQIVSAPAGDLTFSAYLRLPQNITGGSKPGVYLLVANASGIIIAATERVSVSNNEYFRLDVPFSLETAQDISVNILMNGSGSVYVSAPQLETNNFASKYNLVTNGDFKIVANDASWTKTSGATCSTDDNFNLGSSLKIVGNIVATNGASQNIDIHSAESTRETYQLSGWAKGSGVADRERAGLENAKFTLKATVHYVESANQEPDVFEAPFNTAINDWQYMTLQFAKT